MRKLTHSLSMTTLVLVAFILISSCKKKTEDPVPTFTVTSANVSLTGGGTGLQFFAKCTNNGVSMTNVTITNPSSGVYTHKYNGASYIQNASIPMQGTDTAYLKQTGTWKFNLVGSSSGGTAFAIDATVAISK